MSMRVGGFGELESYRRAMRKDDARVANARNNNAAPAKDSSAPAASAELGDAVQISTEGRMRARLHSLPDVRQEKIDAAKAKLESGELDQPEVVERGVRRMLDNLVNGDL